ncbi:MAG TPA: hypothetical protein VHZ07_27105 [Bryobacteraceae bacterium]|jgi:hypothetical protein|nr:hypothetical protein [Bryobacteraceae bacterium]
MKKLKLKLLFSAFTLLACAGVLSAQDLFTWSYVALNGDSASGTLVATAGSNPFEWDVDSISGTWTSPTTAITGLTSGYGNNNLFYYGFSGTSSSLGNGIGFTTANSNVVVFNNGNELIYADGAQISSSGYNTTAISPNGYQFAEIGPATTAPWEPSDAVFLSGALAFGFMQYRRLRRRNMLA